MNFLLPILVLFLNGTDSTDNGFAYRRLTWSDFQGSAKGEYANQTAGTAIQIYLQTAVNNGKIYFTVEAYFCPKHSFVNVRLKNDALLQHAQTQFDIEHMMALRCMVDLKPLQGIDSSITQKVKRILERYRGYADNLNNEFDHDTEHGTDMDQEGRWRVRITTEIAEWEKMYKDVYQNP